MRVTKHRIRRCVAMTSIRATADMREGSSLVRDMHAWGQERASNIAMFRILEIFGFVFLHHEFGVKELHFYQ